MSASPKDSRIPVTILTGYLGSGKTTLLNHVLTEKHNLRLAIIENEFGDVGIDDLLLSKRRNNSNVVENSDEEVVEMMNGCVCCTVRGDLIKVIRKILDGNKGRPFDGMIIETTGLADPAPVAQTFFVDEDIAKSCYLDAIITVVDAKHIIPRIDEQKPEGVENESIEQLAFADKVVLNKIDLVSPEEKEEVKKRIRAINHEVQIIESTQCQVDTSLLLGIKGFSLDKVLIQEPDFLDTSGEHQHDLSITSISFQIDDPLSIDSIEDWISQLLVTKGNDMLRYKGVINIKGVDKKFVFQGVHMLFNGEFGDVWSENEIRTSKFVFIGKNLNRDELTTGFMNCKASETLRFAVGDEVEAYVGKGDYRHGTIIKLWDEGNPYRIRLDDGTEVWGPADVNKLVRAYKKRRNGN